MQANGLESWLKPLATARVHICGKRVVPASHGLAREAKPQDSIWEDGKTAAFLDLEDVSQLHQAACATEVPAGRSLTRLWRPKFRCKYRWNTWASAR